MKKMKEKKEKKKKEKKKKEKRKTKTKKKMNFRSGKTGQISSALWSQKVKKKESIHCPTSNE